jgi:hypothetical protein
MKKEQDYKRRINHEENELRSKILKKSEARSLDEDELELVRGINLTKQAKDLVIVKDNRKHRTEFIEQTRQRQKEREQARATVLDKAFTSSPVDPLEDYPSWPGNKRNKRTKRKTVLEVQRQEDVSIWERSEGSFREVGMYTEDALKAVDMDDRENFAIGEGRTKASHHEDGSAQAQRKEKYSGKPHSRRPAEANRRYDPCKIRYDCAKMTTRDATQTTSRTHKDVTLLQELAVNALPNMPDDIEKGLKQRQSSLHDHFTKTSIKSSSTLHKQSQASPTPDRLPIKRSRDHSSSAHALSKRIKESEAETVKKTAPAVLTDFCDRLLKTSEFLPDEVNMFNVLMLALSGDHPYILRPCHLSRSSLPYKVDAVKDGVHITLQEEQQGGKKLYLGVKVFSDPAKEPLYWTRLSGRERKYV